MKISVTIANYLQHTSSLNSVSVYVLSLYFNYAKNPMPFQLTLFRIKKNFNYTNHYATTSSISLILPLGLLNTITMDWHSTIY